MKRKNLVIVTLLLLPLLFFSRVKADSGFDYDYDSGGYDYGWSDSDSGWIDHDIHGYDSDYSGSSSLSDSDALIFLIVIFVIFIISMSPVIVREINTISKYQKNKKIVNDMLNNRNEDANELFEKSFIQEKQYMSTDEITKIIPEYNEDEFKYKAFDIYKNVQYAWMEFDEELLRENTTDELFNMYNSQMKTLKIKNQQNIMEDINLLDFKIIDVKVTEYYEEIVTNMTVTQKDYIISNDNIVLRGNSNKINTVTYKLVYRKIKNSKIKCPNCGNEINTNHSTECEYCHNKIYVESNDYVLAQKEIISQR